MLVVMSLKEVTLRSREGERRKRHTAEPTVKFQDKAPNMCKPQAESSRTMKSRCSVCV